MGGKRETRLNQRVPGCWTEISRWVVRVGFRVVGVLSVKVCCCQAVVRAGTVVEARTAAVLSSIRRMVMGVGVSDLA